MKCCNCGKTEFSELENNWHQCSGCGWLACYECGGTGMVDAPFSGSDPCCEACGGEGVLSPEAFVGAEG